MKILAEIEIPDDFYVKNLAYPELLKAIRCRLENAVGNEWPFARMNAVRITDVTVTNLPWSLFGPCPYCGEKDQTKFVVEDKKVTGAQQNRYGCATCDRWWNSRNRTDLGPQALQTKSEDNEGRR